MKKISIIVPIYNMEKYLPACIESLNKQKFNDEVEVILIDDGSTDNSLQIMKKMTEGSKCFRIIHQDNQGVSSARNTGLHNAMGEYIAWVDPDDYLTDDWYIEIRKILILGIDLVFFDYRKEFHGDTVLYECVKYGDKSRMIDKDELIYELTRNYKFESQLWSKIFRRELFNDIFFSPEITVREDYDVMTKIIDRAVNVYYLSKILYVYRQRFDSLVHVGARELNEKVMAVDLSWKRYEYLKRKNYKVSKIGLLYDCMNFCKFYQMNDVYNTERLKVLYMNSLNIIRYSIVDILLENRFNLINKIDSLAICLGFVKYLEKAKQEIKKYLK